MIELENNKRFLYQWELNQRVLVDGCKPGARVEFTALYKGADEPLPVSTYEDDGHVYAPIPNILLQEDGYIRVFVSQPAQEKDFKIVLREKPEDYVYSETPLLMVDASLGDLMEKIIKQAVDAKTAEILDELKADTVIAALLDEIKRLNIQCKNYALICNQILQDCTKIKKSSGGEGK